jgi:hypothetical protein
MSKRTGVWRPDDRAEAIYRYVPVQVRPGTTRLRVSLDYDPSGGAVLDLGCFDPAGAFRGYSGGARGEFEIGVEAATPGYLPGPLPPGTWQVLLTLHRIPGDVRWSVTADADRSTVESFAPVPSIRSSPGRDLPAPGGYTWLAGDLHAHTTHSDGTLSVGELARAAEGLDFLAVTDHNTVSHFPYLSAGDLILVPGQEVTTGRGHANAFGDIGWIDFRTPPDQWVSTVDERGGLLSINHPLAADCAWLHPIGTKPPLAELWHSGWWDRTWSAPLAWHLAWDGGVPVGGSDFHRPGQQTLGSPTTWVLSADRSVAGVLDGLRHGRTAISRDRAGPVLLRHEDSLVAIDADGLLLAGFTGRRQVVRGGHVRFPAAAGLHWLEDARTEIQAIAA